VSVLETAYEVMLHRIILWQKVADFQPLSPNSMNLIVIMAL
jgi:hypothetical protein